ncbi:hypothetical protein B0H16DRAFT_96691 [Mycena metata]|uniref:Uncharacterized protein n=1 Tax=Mycena metata TaxID=1033252 RepID=A0AAD7I9Z7_9AGAR|nr:hypothetical protein B0H16DRAFT_96691 [Mycena metata]
MAREHVLPVYRAESRWILNEWVPRPRPRQSRPHRFASLEDIALTDRVRQLWRVCTTTRDGSLAETFKLVGSDSDDASASGAGKISTKVAPEDSFLDAVVVDNHGHPEPAPPPRAKSDSSSTGFTPGTLELGILDEDTTQHTRGFNSWIQYRAWPRVVDFFEPRFPGHEENYQAQSWHSRKVLAFSASLCSSHVNLGVL